MSNTINMKVNNQTSKKLPEKSSSELRKEVPINKKDTTAGLRVPGSNWQKFKSLITESAMSEQASENLHAARKRHNPKVRQKMKEQSLISNCANQQKFHFDVAERKPEVNDGLTKVIAMDCEMVGIGNGEDSMIARVSIVNRYGICVYDKYVKPTEEVKDYRTEVSGIRPHHLKNGEDFKTIQKEVAEILRGRILVGHALHNDLTVLFLNHPRRSQRDTSRYKLFRKITNGSTPSLKKLTSELLGLDIQTGEHNSIEDAKAAMQLYQLFRKKWENDLRKKV